MAKHDHPGEQRLAIAMSELRRNDHFAVFASWLEYEREETVRSLTNGTFSEKFGAVSRAAGAVTALDTVIEQVGIVNLFVDALNNQGSTPPRDGAESGRTR